MKKLILITFAILISSNASAETLRLRSGEILDGSLVERPDMYVKISPGEIVWKVEPIVVPKPKAEENEYSFQEIPINEGVSIPTYQYRWDVSEITFNIDPLPPESGVVEKEKKFSYPDGRVKMVCDYQDGILHGTCRTFSQDGSPVLVISYKNGEFDTLAKVYYANGYIYYDASDPKTVKEFYDNGRIKVEKTRESAKLYWKTGELHREVKYEHVSDGRVRGEYYDYDNKQELLNRFSRITHGYGYYMEAGRNDERKGDWPNAIRNYQQAYHISPEAPEVNMALGTVYFKSGNPKSAMSFFERATNLSPNHITSRMAAGVASRMLKNYDTAITYFEEAHSLDRNYYLPALEIGRTYYAWGKMKAAKDNFQKALDINPKALEAYEGLKLAEAQLKK